MWYVGGGNLYIFRWSQLRNIKTWKLQFGAPSIPIEWVRLFSYVDSVVCRYGA